MNHLWLRVLLSKLKKLEIVEKARLTNKAIHVRYKTGISETYFHRRVTDSLYCNHYIIDESNSRLKHVPTIYNQFESGPFDTKHSKHLVIKRSEFLNSSLIAQRIAINMMAKRLHGMDFMRFDYPNHVLRKAWEEIKKERPYGFIRSNNFINITHKEHIYKVLMHYFDFTTPMTARRIVRIISRLKVKGDDITTERVARLIRRIWGPQIFNPAVYANILSRLKINGPVIDMHPQRGHKALACAILGLPYCPIPENSLDEALNLGISDLTGLNVVKLSDFDMAALLISDNNFKSYELDLSLADRAKHLLAFARMDERGTALKPAITIKIYRDYETRCKKLSDYILFW